jgi:signal transduction histidine kinase
MENQVRLTEQARQAAAAERAKTTELAVAVEKAETANRAKSEFLSNMSHELRTPLNHIIGFTQLVADENIGGLNAEQKEYLGDVLDSSNHLLSLINDILDLAKVESGKMDLNTDLVHLGPLLEGSLTMVKERAQKLQIQLETQLDDIPGTIVADERKLKQIVYNLLSNAVKFTSPGGCITLSAESFSRGCESAESSDGVPGDGGDGDKSMGSTAAPMVIISVSDTGIGIAPDHLTSIFEPFVQVDSSAGRLYEGTGLGLSLTERLVRLHGGKLWAESEGEGRGSRFCFSLPALGPDTCNPVSAEMIACA